MAMSTINPSALMLEARSAFVPDANNQRRLSPLEHQQNDSPGAQRSSEVPERVSRASGIVKRSYNAVRGREKVWQELVPMRITKSARNNMARSARHSPDPMVRLEITEDGTACIVVDRGRHAAWRKGSSLWNIAVNAVSAPARSKFRARTAGPEVVRELWKMCST